MNVAELADAVGAEKRALDALVRGLRGDVFRQPTSGTHTVKDTLGHVAAYLEAERLALAAGVGRSNQAPEPLGDYETWNQHQYELRRRRVPERIIAELDENGARYLSLVKGLYEEDLIKRIRFPWNDEGTVHELVLQGLRHRREHREELERVLGQGT